MTKSRFARSRLSGDEAARVLALAALALIALVPSLVRVVSADASIVAPKGMCRDGAVWSSRQGQVLCGSGTEKNPGLGAAESLLLGTLLDLNEADASSLELIPGVGPTLAARIVSDRQEHGLFSRVEDVHRVRGVGRKRSTTIVRYARVRSEPNDPDHPDHR